MKYHCFEFKRVLCNVKSLTFENMQEGHAKSSLGSRAINKFLEEGRISTNQPSPCSSEQKGESPLRNYLFSTGEILDILSSYKIRVAS